MVTASDILPKGRKKKVAKRPGERGTLLALPPETLLGRPRKKPRWGYQFSRPREASPRERLLGGEGLLGGGSRRN